MFSERDFLPCILFISFLILTIKAENYDPELTLDGRVDIPVFILKGLEGTIELQVYIDQKGQVESCEIIGDSS